MSEQDQTLNEVVESTFDEQGTPDFDSPEYIQSVVNEFSDVLGLGAGTEPAQAEPQAEPQTAQSAETETTTEQAGDTSVAEQVDQGADANAFDQFSRQDSTKSQSQLIEERARADEAKRSAEAAQKQAIEQARLEAQSEIFKQARIDPVRWAESLAQQGIDIGQVAMAAYRVALGDKAPPELIKRTQKGPEAVMSEMERRFAEQERKFEERQRQLELKQIALGYEEYLTSVPESEPYLRNAVQKNRDAVKQNLFNIADAFASQNGRYPNVRELTAEYNRQIREVAELHGISLTQASTPAKPAAPSTPKAAPEQTLSEAMSDRAQRGVEAEDLSDEALERAAAEWWNSQQRA